MNPKSTPRTTLTRIVTTMLVASALSTTAAHAASFQYRHPVVGLVSSPTAQAQQVVTEILMALTGGPALPAGEVNWPYSYDLKQLLSVTGDPAYNSSNVSWELQSGQLPAGLSLGIDGVISGTPTTKNAEGSSFQVTATYKTKSGQQAYTIVVNGALLHVTQISAGWNHTCAVTTAGGVKCWGQNTHGELGNNSSANSSVPVDVFGLTSGISAVSARGYHSCALTTGGSLKCWGFGDQGQLGNNSVTSSKVPVDVWGLGSGVASVSAGSNHTCAVTTAGGVKCWGSQSQGQLGSGTTIGVNQPKPVDVVGLASGVARVSAGIYHTCALTTSGGLKCWGSDGHGELGNDAALTNQPTPVSVLGLTSGVASFFSSGYHTCAVTTAGALKCWGYDVFGQLGNDTALTDQPTPVSVLGLTSGVASVSGGVYHTCALTTSGGLKCWGADGYGELGNDAALTNQPTPVSVLGLTSGVAALYSGGYHTCAVTTTGSTKCWGNNSAGQLGNNSTVSSGTPVDVAP